MQFNDTKSTVAERTRTTNFEGGEAFEPDTPELALYKVVINNLLEDSFYESDEDSFDKVRERFEECAEANPEFVLKLAYYAREEMYLRQIPQLLLVFAANHGETQEYVREYSTGVMQRADEPLEVLAMQVKLFGKSIPNPLQDGIEDALHTFDEYEYAKYDSDRREFSYRDLLNLVHPKPRDDLRDDLFERIALGELDDYPEVEPLRQHRTWEDTMSNDEDDRSQAEKFRDRLDDMGLFAKIRNVRNMLDAGLDAEEILTDEDLDAVPHVKLFPFRFYQAYQAVKDAGYHEPHLDNWFEAAIDRSVENVPEEFEDTYVASDTSGSMTWAGISEQSNLTPMEIGALFGAVCASKGAKASAFATTHEEIQHHAGAPVLSIQETIKDAPAGGGTHGHKVIQTLRARNESWDNVALFTDMQLWGGSLKDEWDKYKQEVNPDANLYIVDLASYGDLVVPEGYDSVYRVSGWNENIIKHIKYASRTDAAIQEVESVGTPE